MAVAGGGENRRQYLRTDLLLAAAREHGAQAIYPATASCRRAPNSPRLAEHEHRLRRPYAAADPRVRPEASLAQAAAETGVPSTPGTGLLASLGEALTRAERIGYPVMLKSTAGGGGIGLSRCDNEAELSGGVRQRAAHGRTFLPRRRRVHRALCGQRPPRRGADLRRRRRPRAGPGRARLLGAAAQPEGDRGNTSAAPAGRDPRGAAGCGGQAGRVRWPTARPARSNSSTTRRATASTSWRPTPACRWSTR